MNGFTDLKIGNIRKFAPKNAEAKYTKGELRMHLLWAVGEIEKFAGKLAELQRKEGLAQVAESHKWVKEERKALETENILLLKQAADLRGELTAERNLVSDMEETNNKLRHKLDREIAVSRELAKKLNDETALTDEWHRKATDYLDRATKAEWKVKNMANAFMWLHNLAKDDADPPQRPVTAEVPKPEACPNKAQPPLFSPPIRPTFGEMLKAAEAEL